MTYPKLDGLYNPAYEHDACGVAFVARLDNEPRHEVVQKAIQALCNIEHRGAAGADPLTGDGAGILVQMPDQFFRAVVPFDLPAVGSYGVAMCFLPQDSALRAECEAFFQSTVEAEGQRVLGWRDVPVDTNFVGSTADQTRPQIRQLFIAADQAGEADQDHFERKLYVIRKVVERKFGAQIAVPSLSSRTTVYKGMLMSGQVSGFFPDLQDQRFTSAIGLVHSRFSTNTFPSWELSHPYRMIAHNGEINTVMGNRNWMRARESQLASELFGDDLEKILPVVQQDASDSATFDNVLELLHLGGRSLPHAVMMMVPEAYQGRDDISDELKGFYDYHSCLIEPWDGPAAVAFTDGRVIGATLDRNGLRPGRWLVTDDGWIVLSSESGSLPFAEESILRKGRLQPGKLFFVDLQAGRIVEDAEVKAEVAAAKPYGEWFNRNVLHIDDLPKVEGGSKPLAQPRHDLQRAFGYSEEDLRILLKPMASSGDEPIGSMGIDTALAVLSDRQPPLFSYFKQLFAQVTNPAIDPIREECVMSVGTGVGAEGNLLDETPEHAHQLVMSQPVLLNDQLEQLRQVSHDIFSSHTIDITWPVSAGPEAMAEAVERICSEAEAAVADGANILILSDRQLGPERAAVPSLLAVAATHHHLVRAGTRLQAGLVIESGEPREIHHFATLIGFGASAVNPYLLFESVKDLAEQEILPANLSVEQAQANVIKAIGKGLRKTISKMGISTIQSYCGAQIFEAVGLRSELVDRYFCGTASRIGGVGIKELAQEALLRHGRAYPAEHEDLLPVGGIYAWRRDGEHHMWNPETVPQLQYAVREGGTEAYREYARTVNEDAARRATLRGLLRFRDDLSPIPLDQVEPAKEIVKRFATGAMSLGSISTESHETLAVAMNRLGGKSNTGEGGEDARRFTPDENGDSRRSSIKQVASGRFGVTINYLVNADEIQIKVAQGAKPGEGGQLPCHKVDRYIGKIRHSTPGVGLISPPPHHDIYSIEDLKQLIYDLRCANPQARISVKLVSEVGVGTVAAGVAKANSDHVVIAGHDGGTGASPLSSIQSDGVPWEIGLAETQQTLLKNDLRSRVYVQTDGQIKTGRDVAIAAMLGADEIGFSTAPLIAMGCIMMRACHLNTCPVGIATQDPELRKRFEGKPEHVVNFCFFVAEELREIMASLGISRFDDLIGRVDLLQTDDAVEHWKASGVDLSALLAFPEGVDPAAPRRRVREQEPVLESALDWELLRQAEPAVADSKPVKIETQIQNVNLCVGGILSGEISRKHGVAGLPEGTVDVTFRGAAGQSFGGWLAPGVSFTLFGDTNDYTGKGLSGGILAVRPPLQATYVPEDNVIIGNTVLYGATSGRAFFRGLAGERFAVRNSGASAVVEGVGDHGCEYMTGGRVVVLGPTGRNFAAGMSGGVAYVYDPEGSFPGRCNMGMVGFDPIDAADEIELRELVTEHRDRTGSTVAERILAEWQDALGSFVKVMPTDYKRALAELEAERVSV